MHMVITCIEVKIEFTTPPHTHTHNLLVFSMIFHLHNASNSILLFADVVPWLVQIVVGVFNSGTPGMELFYSHIPVIRVM